MRATPPPGPRVPRHRWGAIDETGGGAEESGPPALGVRWARLLPRRPVTVPLAARAGPRRDRAAGRPRMELGRPDEGTGAADTTRRRAYDLSPRAPGLAATARC